MALGSVGDFLFGRALADAEEEHQRIGVLAGIPVLGLDALSSAAYGPEAALALLVPLGSLGVSYIGVITAIVAAILGVVFLSYRQTIAAYPNGGGSYTVAKENLGTWPALVAGAALAVDYVLNVAVGISAGVGALVSAVPSLFPHTLGLCLLVLGVLTIVNLRGTRETGFAFMVPTYAFVVLLLAVLGAGTFAALRHDGAPIPVVAPPVPGPALETASLWLLARAFASGCTAMTGVEAVSNAVPIFRAPTVKEAQRTLTAIIAILLVLLGGIAYLARAYGIGATDASSPGYQSVLSQLVAAVFGRGLLYYVTLGAIVTVLALSANTSFADFPRLCRMLALDRHLPDFFAQRGRRLVFTAGIVVLAVLAGALLVAFGGVTDRLIPLFAVGAFLAFTLSQAGMVRHWQKEGGPHARHALPLNALGALATGATLVVVVVSKFAEGAWLTVVVVPLVVLLFHRVHCHYASVAKEILDASPLAFESADPPIVVVPVQGWNKLTKRGLRFAMELSPDVFALHVRAEGAPRSDLATRWEELVGRSAHAVKHPLPKLLELTSSYRQFFAPLLDWVDRARDANPQRVVVVVVPDLVVRHWYHALLHNNRGTLLKALLRLRGGPRVLVMSTPFYLRDE